ASAGHWPDRPWVELARVSLAASAPRASPHPAEGRTDGTAVDPSAPGPPFWPDTSPYADKDSGRARKRGSPSTKSRVTDPLLFSRTTHNSLLKKIDFIRSIAFVKQDLALCMRLLLHVGNEILDRVFSR